MLRVIGLIILGLFLASCASNIKLTVIDQDGKAKEVIEANDYVIRERTTKSGTVSRVYTPKSIFTAADLTEFLSDLIPLAGSAVTK
jgi:hypothetical protein